MIVQIIESTLIYIGPEIVISSPWVYKFAGRKYSLAVIGHCVSCKSKSAIVDPISTSKNHNNCQNHDIVPKKVVVLILESKALPLD